MLGISGTVRIGEANKACATIGRRQRGSIAFFYLVMALLAAAGSGLGFLADHYLPNPWGIEYWLIGLWFGVMAYIFVGRKVLTWRFRKWTAAKGTPIDMPMHLKIEPEALSYELAGVSHRAPWPIVSELFLAKGYWIFLVNVESWFAPKRLFATESEERAFVREALSYMSEEARGRSADAVAFASGDKA